MDYKWTILELSAENEVITHAKYHLSLSDDTNTVETEGNWCGNGNYCPTSYSLPGVGGGSSNSAGSSGGTYSSGGGGGWGASG